LKPVALAVTLLLPDADRIEQEGDADFVDRNTGVSSLFARDVRLYSAVRKTTKQAVENFQPSRFKGRAEDGLVPRVRRFRVLLFLSARALRSPRGVHALFLPASA
jgi:hypothetical protein